ncbi:DUF192 domain-containing protein [Candidatus Peregrinibacteria bacterium]|nr:MAG: DUF192 domain-containing protein [Candidatus Peregrinibacteria bacterium]
MSIKKIGLIAGVLLGLAACQPSDPKIQLTIQTEQASISVNAEVALTAEEKRIGLMNRTHLEEGMGMLFIYSDPFVARFWMKDTLIPLDMIFIDSQYTIKRIEHAAPPCPPETQCPIYSSETPVQYILEVPGGFVKKHHIEIDDTVTWQQ